MGGEGAGHGIYLWAVQFCMEGSEKMWVAEQKKQKNKMATHKYLKQGPLQEQIGTKMKQTEASQLKHAHRHYKTLQDITTYHKHTQTTGRNDTKPLALAQGTRF